MGLGDAKGDDQIVWQDGVPASARYGDPFYALEDGAAESAHVFLDGNDLPARFTPDFHIAELGFGTGLNVLVAWQAFRQAGPGGTLRVTSFEAHPISPGDMAAAHAAFPALAALSAPFVAAWSAGTRRAELPGLSLDVVAGDATATLPRWDGLADAWFLDGFAPAKNPALWSAGLMADVARRTAPGGTFATYTAAGHVRRSLATAGFDVVRVPGFGRKRHMSRGVLRRVPSMPD